MASKPKGTFASFNPKAKIFNEIKIRKPHWWNMLIDDKELYIHIRKDNYINVYYFGGSILKINYDSDFLAETHQKYLGYNKPRGKTKEGKDKFVYVPINLKNLNEEKVFEIKNHIKDDYLKYANSENPAEKWIQGKMIMESSNYIDSEFQFNRDAKIGRLRIDLIELSEGVLSFIELKGIFDSRLRNDKKRNPKPAEIIAQMKKYQMFINKYEDDIKDYYQKLIGLKWDLGLTTMNNTEFVINKKPKLTIADTYNKMTKRRKDRICDINDLLKRNNIDYEIIKWK